MRRVRSAATIVSPTFRPHEHVDGLFVLFRKHQPARSARVLPFFLPSIKKGRQYVTMGTKEPSLLDCPRQGLWRQAPSTQLQRKPSLRQPRCRDRRLPSLRAPVPHIQLFDSTQELLRQRRDRCLIPSPIRMFRASTGMNVQAKRGKQRRSVRPVKERAASRHPRSWLTRWR